MKITKVSNFKNQLGEGVWWDDDNMLLHWTDILEGKLYSFNLKTQKETYKKFNGNLGCFAPCNDGNFLYIGNYNQGSLNGRWQTFHLNGRLFSMGNFIEGKKEGLWEYFNEQGELFKIQIFENDILIKCEGKFPVKEEESN